MNCTLNQNTLPRQKMRALSLISKMTTTFALKDPVDTWMEIVKDTNTKFQTFIREVAQLPDSAEKSLLIDFIIEYSDKKMLSGVTIDRRKVVPNNSNEFRILFSKLSEGSSDPSEINLKFERFETLTTATQRKDANLDYLDKSYGAATVERDRVLQELRVALYNILYINRDASANQRDRITLTEADLNKKIKIFLLALIRNIVSWALNQDEAIRKRFELLIKSPNMYDSKGKYTNILHKCEEALIEYLDPSEFSSARILELTVTRDSKSGEKSHNAKLLLEAYASWLHLRNFDSMLAMVTDGSISYSSGKFSDMDFNKTYTFASKSSANFEQWQTQTEEIDVSKHISKPVQMAVETTPLYDFTGTPQEGQYCSFLEAVYNICAIKSLPYTVNKTIYFSDSVLKEDDFRSLSEGTRNYIRLKTLATVIHNWRSTDGIKAIRATFELLANEKTFQYLENQGCFNITKHQKAFNKLQRNIIYSLWRGIMAEEQITLLNENSTEGHPQVPSNSIWAINKPFLDQKNIFFTIIQEMDSVSLIHYLQYFRDAQSKLISTRDMRGGAIELIAYKKRLDIASRNSHEAGNWSTFKDRYKCETEIKTEENNKDNVKSRAFKCVLLSGKKLVNGQEVTEDKVKVTVNQLDGSVSVEAPETFSPSEIEALHKVLANVTGITLTPKADNCAKIIKLCSSILSTLNLQEDIFTYLEDNYGNDAVTQSSSDIYLKSQNIRTGIGGPYSYRNNIINIILKNVVGDFKDLIEIWARESGQLNGNLIAAGDNKKLSSATISRLLNRVKSLNHLLNSRADSASSGLSFIRNEGLFKNVYTAKEFNTGDEVIQHVNFNAGEYASSAIIYLFLDGLSTKTDGNYGILGDGTIGFYPSVNSDKTTINCLVIDANKKVAYSRTKYTIDEIKELFSNPPEAEERRNLLKVLSEETNARNLIRAVYTVLNIHKDALSYSPLMQELFLGATKNADALDSLFKEEDLTTLKQLISGIIGDNKSSLYSWLKAKDPNACVFLESCQLFKASEPAIALNKLTDTQLDEFTKLELGSVYTNSYWKINSDFYKLFRADYSNIFKHVKGISDATINDNNKKFTERLHELITSNDFLLDGFSATNEALWLLVAEFPSLANNPVELVKALSLEYNSNHRTEPIKLIDLTHYIDVNGELFANTTLIANMYRYGGMLELGNHYSGLIDIDQFNRKKEAELLGSLCKAGFTLDMRSKESAIEDLLGGKFKDYNLDISDFKDNTLELLILAKFTFTNEEGLPETVNIRDKYDLEILKNRLEKMNVTCSSDMAYLSLVGTLELNPVIKRYNKLHHVMTQSYMISTVGSAMNHPNKGFKDIVSKSAKKPKTSRKTSDLKLFGEVNKFAELPGDVKTLTLKCAPEVDAKKPLAILKEGSLIYNNEEGEDGVLYQIHKVTTDVAKADGAEITCQVIKYTSQFDQSAVSALFTPNLTLLYNINPHVHENGVPLTEEERALEIANLASSALNTATKFFITDEAARFQAQHKRNVSFTATMEEFTLGNPDGIPETYNIAVIDDIKAVGYNVSGDIDDGIKPYDGAMWVHPAFVLLENNSLGEHRAGLTKKHFCHFVDEATGTAGIIKTCGFGIRNANMRTQVQYQNIFYKMSNHKWLDENGVYLSNYDITRDYYGNSFFGGENPSKFKLDPIIFKKNGHYYQITNIINAGDNYYRIQGKELTVKCANTQLDGTVTGEGGIADITAIFSNTKGVEVTSDTVKNAEGEEVTDYKVKIDTNWALWNVLGAHNSLTREGNNLVGSEASIKNLVTIMNKTSNKIEPNRSAPTSSKDIFLPLKHSDIHYLVSAGAMKHGTGNMNHRGKYSNDEAFDFFKVKMQLIGIQLDKEHHVDDSELSLMTQVLSACAHRGFTHERCMDLYRAIANLAELECKDLLAPLRNYVQAKYGSDAMLLGSTKDALIVAAIQKVVESVARSREDASNLITTVTRDLVKSIKEGKTLTKDLVSTLPIDDPSIYSLFVQEVILFLNRGIRLKIPGLLSVLTPSYDFFKTYNGYTWAELENLVEWTDPETGKVETNVKKWKDPKTGETKTGVKSPKDWLDYMQNCKKHLFNAGTQSMDFTDLVIGKSYRVKLSHNPEDPWQIFDLSDPLKYYALKDFIRANSKNPQLIVLEYIIAGKNLGSYNVKFMGTSRDELGRPVTKRYLLYDLDAIRGLYELRDIAAGDFTALLNWITEFQASIPEGIWQSVEIPMDDTEAAVNVLANLCRRAAQLSLMATSSAGDVIQNGVRSSSHVRIGGQEVAVDRTSLKKYAYEIIISKRNRDQFKLTDEDNMAKINDPNFFYNKILDSLVTNVSPKHYTLLLKKLNGKNVSLLTETLYNKLVDAQTLDGLHRVEYFSTTVNGKTYVADQNNTPLFAIRPEDVLMEDKNGNLIIVMANTKIKAKDESGVEIEQVVPGASEAFYLNDLEYFTLAISPEVLSDSNEAQAYLNALNTSENIVNHTAKNWFKFATGAFKSGAGTRFISLQSAYSNNREALAKALESNAFLENRLTELAEKLRNSFETTLDVVVSRTPSQSMQSFMGMRVVAFENENLNNAYVSHAQIWLQGSDYDVDAASIAQFEVDDSGVLYTWSPYAKLLNKKLTLDSLELPFPTFERKEIISYSDIQSNEKYTDGDRAKIQNTILKMLNVLGKDLQELNKNGEILGENDDIAYLKYEDSGIVVESRGTAHSYENLSKLGELITLANSLPAFVDPTTIVFEEAVVGKGNVPDTKSSFIRDGLAILKLVLNDVNHHNTWLKAQNVRKQTYASMNYTLHLMYEIIMDPSNLFLAMQSVDGVTGPAKKAAKKSDKMASIAVATPGNFMNLVESANANAVGKTAIGICAVSLKDFFALTSYVNEVVAHGTQEELANLIKEVKFAIPNKNGSVTTESRFMLANSVLKADVADRLRKSNPDLYNLLNNLTQNADAAIALSAMLSLSTDNAKELCLDPLNANPAMISLYLYGITMGLSIEQCASIIMSPVGDIFSSLLNGNKFAGLEGCARVDQIIKYFEKFPTNLLAPYIGERIKIGKSDEDSFGGTMYTTVINNVVEAFDKVNSVNKKGYPAKDTIKDIIKPKAKSEEELDESYAEVEDDEETTRSYGISELRKIVTYFLQNTDMALLLCKDALALPNLDPRVARCIRDLERYCTQLLTLNTTSNKAAFDSMKQLNAGAKELFTLGRLLGLNLGLKPSTQETLARVSLFLEILPDLDLSEFVHNAAYRELKIREYHGDAENPGPMVSFNILQCITKVPQFFEYLQLLEASHNTLKTISGRYQACEAAFINLAPELGVISQTDKTNLIRGIGNYYTYKMYNKFLSELSSDPKSAFYDLELSEIPHLGADSKDFKGKLLLGTVDGNAAFKKFMEKVVIPRLKDMEENGSSGKKKYANNTFILDLTVGVTDKTPTHRIMSYYKLDATMLPKTTDEQRKFDAYKNDLMALEPESFVIVPELKDASGNIILKERKLNLLEMFYVYTLIAHGTKMGLDSLKPLFTDYLSRNSGLISIYNEVVGQFSQEFLETLQETFGIKLPKNATKEEKADYKARKAAFMWEIYPWVVPAKLNEKLAGTSLKYCYIYNTFKNRFDLKYKDGFYWKNVMNSPVITPDAAWKSYYAVDPVDAEAKRTLVLDRASTNMQNDVTFLDAWSRGELTTTTKDFTLRPRVIFSEGGVKAQPVNKWSSKLKDFMDALEVHKDALAEHNLEIAPIYSYAPVTLIDGIQPKKDDIIGIIVHKIDATGKHTVILDQALTQKWVDTYSKDKDTTKAVGLLVKDAIKC